ncbi:arylesterase [Ruegeria aquimaris]|uniref:Arylesterase n=1 Tax=Ruegeria aquimaris TaxID=2984333 RepID=A0ABT3AH50_9RHOB|nr:arylesterase [Ruegeria sp. XHP0148]MCV2887960.1 arylesterase [Ruegeria sp. XHP0148]
MRKVLFWLMLGVGAVPVAAEPVVIAALGDSLTQGYGLPADDGFVPQLQSWARAKGADVILINAGVSGDTSAGGAARIGWTLTPDVDGLIVTLGGNDLLRGLAPDMTRRNLTEILVAAQSAGVAVLLIGMQAPGNYGVEYKTNFDAIYPDLANQFDTLYVPSFFSALGEDPASIVALMQGDGIHPNAEGVGRIVEAVGPAVLELIERADN